MVQVDRWGLWALAASKLCCLAHSVISCQVAGYDSCSHMAEETRGADASVPKALLVSIGASIVMGFLHVMSLLFSIQVSPQPLAQQRGLPAGMHCRWCSSQFAHTSYTREDKQHQIFFICFIAFSYIFLVLFSRGVQDPANLGVGSAGSSVTSQIYIDVFEARFSSPVGGLVCLGINLVATFLQAPRLLWLLLLELQLVRVLTAPCVAQLPSIQRDCKLQGGLELLKACTATLLATCMRAAANRGRCRQLSCTQGQGHPRVVVVQGRQQAHSDAPADSVAVRSCCQPAGHLAPKGGPAACLLGTLHSWA